MGLYFVNHWKNKRIPAPILIQGACFGPSSEVYPVQLYARDIPCMKILVVDDHVLIREAMRGVLRELRGDMTVLEAGKSQQAMEIVAAEHADLGLIWLALNSPDRDGFAV